VVVKRRGKKTPSIDKNLKKLVTSPITGESKQICGLRIVDVYNKSIHHTAPWPISNPFAPLIITQSNVQAISIPASATSYVVKIFPQPFRA